MRMPHGLLNIDRTDIEPINGRSLEMDAAPDKHVMVSCPYCAGETRIGMKKAKWDHWQDGQLIQYVWPDLTVDQRELLMTGFHDECWDKVMT